MKSTIKQLPMKALASFSFLAGLAPVYLLLGRFVAPARETLWYMPAVCAWGIGTAGFLLRGKKRLALTFIACTAFILWGVFSLIPKKWETAFITVPCIAILLALPPTFGKQNWEEWSGTVWAAGGVCHFFGQAAVSRPELSDVSGILRPFFLMYVFLLLMYMNRMSLRTGVHGAEKIPARLRRRNALYVLLLFLSAAAVSLWRQLAEWLAAIGMFTKSAVQCVFSLIGMLFQHGGNDVSGPAGGESFSMMLDAEEAEPSAFAVFMESVFRIVFMIAAVLLLIVLLVLLFRGVKKMWKSILTRFRLYADAAADEYVDEVESTLNWEEQASVIRNRLKKRLSGAENGKKWRQMDAREKVRTLYRRYILGHPDASFKTVREALGADRQLPEDTKKKFIRLYELARYSQHEIADKDADALKESL